MDFATTYMPSVSESSPPSGRSAQLPLVAEIFSADRTFRDHLQRLLLRHPAITVTRTPESLGEVSWSGARLLFCDLDGESERVLRMLGERPSSLDVILLAGEERWAAAAFEVDALDFLVKPVESDRVGRTVRRLLRLDWAAGSAEVAESVQRIFVPFERGRRLIAIDDICAIHAIGNYTQVLLAGGATEVVMRSLVRWEATLGGGRFIRIHRSTIANVARIRRLEVSASGEGGLAEIEGLSEKQAVSRRCLAALRAALATARQPGDDRSSKTRGTEGGPT